MAELKYEIKPVNYPDYYFESEIATLTGLEFNEIILVTKHIKRWSGQTYIKVFHKLGFNCNNRFVKFDKETKYPCLMRCRRLRIKESCWWGFIYYDGKIHIPGEVVLTWEEWNRYYPNYRATSMLQVWI